ncbi:hypothetical protein A9Q79_10360 [Methylophaga sp. 42_25_T18]|nr:hypothetical protein A9Q79_10360 [Methylophaga sp. 42_25_T18]
MDKTETDLRQAALACLVITDPLTKVEHTQRLYQRWLDGELTISTNILDVPEVAGHPDKPELVAPKDLPRRRNSKESGVASLIHAVNHIEFNAINLALDAVARFADMPEQYYADWARVAFEESQHFMLLREHLLTLGYDYGDFPAHSGMWDMAKKTHGDVLKRMALVPRVLEARGLDVTPKMMNKLRGSGDHRAVEILEIILREEIGHVAIGTHWFNYLCDLRQLDPLATFKDLLDTYFDGQLRGPFHTEARMQAGFTEAEMALLEGR